MTLEHAAWIALALALVVILALLDRRAGIIAAAGVALGALVGWRVTRREEPGPEPRPDDTSANTSDADALAEDMRTRTDATDTDADDTDARAHGDDRDLADLVDSNADLRERLRRRSEDREPGDRER